MQKKIKNIKLLYASYSIIPSKNANSVHVTKMTQSLKKIFQDVLLLGISPSLFKKETNSDISNHYGLGTLLNMQTFYRLKGAKSRDYIYRVRRATKQYSPDFIYTRSVSLAKHLSDLNVPIALECHSTLLNAELDDFKLLLKTGMLKFIVVISESLKIGLTEQLSSLTLPSLHVLHDGVDLDFFEKHHDTKLECRKKLALPNALTVGYTGHLYPGKGGEVIIELAKVMQKINFLIVGGKDEDVRRYKEIIEKLELKNVTLVGHVENKLVIDYMKASDVLLMPYQSVVNGSGSTINISNWMSPLKMFEYMASNRPIISSDLPVIREVLNEDNSILCDPSNIAEWSKAIELLTQNEEFALKISNNALKDVKGYSWDRRALAIKDEVHDYVK